MRSERACQRCLARSWLLDRLASRLELARGRIELVLELEDDELISAVGGRQRASIVQELAGVDLAQARERASSAGLELICRCDAEYPRRLRALRSPPAVLHVAGGLERFLELVAEDPVAIVGARSASPYGLEIAGSLGRGLGSAGITVLSGMALGIDSAAHSGALTAAGRTVAVLPGSADRPYPAAKRALYHRIRASGALVSELAPGCGLWRWMFPARNRIIAGLAAMTIVVEAGVRSGALLTATFARQLGRPVGAVPGHVTSSLAAGPHGLLAAGAQLVRGPQDVLDQLFGAGTRKPPAKAMQALTPELRTLLTALGDGHGTSDALARAGIEPEAGLGALATLELAGYVRREAGGRFSVVA